jgi:hypothetical protein
MFTQYKRLLIDLKPQHLVGKGQQAAWVAELADALASGASGGNLVKVRILSQAPIASPNLMRFLNDAP